MGKKNISFYCPITHEIFFDPVFLPCNKEHMFEKESLLNWIEVYNQSCPLCRHPVEDDNEIQPANEIKKAINVAINKEEIDACDQYLPRYVLFNLLIDRRNTMPLSRIEKLLKHHTLNQEIPLQEAPLREDNWVPKKNYLIVCALKVWPELMAYFLWESIQTSKLQTIVEKLIKLKTFNEITINQSISKKIGNDLHHYSIAYLLLNNVQGRKILKDNSSLCKLIGERLSANLLNQFLCENTHEGTLYYLLADEFGREILDKYLSLKEKIDEATLSKRIDSGPNQGRFLQGLYDQIYSSTPNKRNK